MILRLIVFLATGQYFRLLIANKQTKLASTDQSPHCYIAHTLRNTCMLLCIAIEIYALCFKF